jgi:hypothetical protein
LALLSPLLMLQLVAAGHNDLMMAGLLAAGIACALSGRPLLGIAVCALAATIKVPALAGVLFIAVAWGRAERGWAPRLRFAAAAAVVTVAVLGAVTVATGAGVSWLSSSLFSTPAKVRLAITPATAIGYTAAALLRDVGVATSGRGLEGALAVVGTALTGLAGVVLLYRLRIRRLVAMLGAFLLIAAAGGPAAWPWYFVWGLVLVAAVPGVAESTALAVAIAVSVFAVKPGGTLALSLHAAPVMVIVYGLVAAGVWSRRRREGTRRTRVPEGAPSALIRT